MEDDIQQATVERGSMLQSNLPIAEKLERARTELLDLSARNRLLNIPRLSKAARTVEVVDERSAEVFRLLVKEGKALTFLPAKSSVRSGEGGDGEPEDDEVADLAQPEDDGVDERGVANRHGDTRLQTRMTSKGLQARLLDLHSDARTLEEEQGTNILFLALGTLRWVDPNNKANIRHAPLILLPVRLDRARAGERFKLRWRGEEQAPNLSLEAYLERVHHLALPHFDAGDEFDPAAYLVAVADAVRTRTADGWEVLPDDIVLGFFSFAKFLMYRDLDPAAWPAGKEMASHRLIRGLLADGFPSRDDLIPEDADIDRHVQPADLLHIVDADGSQTLAVHDVRAGRDLVVQGPPGTGKSQTIANVIAAAVADGKTVLFVAEKMTALEVVKRRLDNAGVGDACLELHSNKANKRALLDELKRTWELGAPRGIPDQTLNERLGVARDGLNGHARRMQAPHHAAGLSPFQVIGHLTRLRRAGMRPTDVTLNGPETWTAEERRRREEAVQDVARRIDDIGLPAEHPWRGVGLDYVLPSDVERLLSRIGALAHRTAGLAADSAELARSIDAEPPRSPAGFAPVAALAGHLAGAPALDGEALGHAAWEQVPAIRGLLAVGTELRDLERRLDGAAAPSAWHAVLDGARTCLGSLPPAFPLDAFAAAAQLAALVPRLLADAEGLRTHLGMDGLAGTPAAIAHVVTMAERVAAAPDASPVAFAATVWDRGVDQAGDLADAVAALEGARAAVSGLLSDAAWDADLRQARQVLAANTGVTRFLSGEWRRSNRLVRSVLARSDLPLPELLAALDHLAKGQAALATVSDGETFGRAAFGEDWRGAKSSAAPLQALVAWMRSLRGLGAEPRLIAGRMPDRSRVADRSAVVRDLLEQVRPALAVIRASVGDGSGALDDVPLRAVADWSALVAAADAASAAALTDVPSLLAERIRLIDQIVAAQGASRALAAGDALGRDAFGPAWAGASSDWDLLVEAGEWVAANADIRLLAARLPDRDAPARLAGSMTARGEEVGRELRTLLDALRTDAATLFGCDLPDVAYEVLGQRFSSWLSHGEALSKWVAFSDCAAKGRALGLADVVARMEDGRLATAKALATFEMSYYEALFADLARTDPALARFDGQLHEGLRREFAELDRERIAASRLEVVRAHHRRIPPAAGGAGPLGALRSEIARRRGHMPIRQLIARAAPVVQALKPVMMMSPLSVAQFLPPGKVAFDLLVMDEASQIQPVDALGAIARCGQVVVVGDERQLPPTRFFSRLTGNQPETDDEGEGAQVADIESILGLFTARGLPQRMLRWHYRSRHQSLIAVSNSQFYENKLFIVPSPYTSEAGMGLRFHHVPDGRFDAGGTSTNAVEARKVAEAVIRHAKEHPGESLGVATFSAAQRRAIQDQLEELRRRDEPGVEDFFHAHQGEPFFLKSLENVQGDERDCIMISVGYGRNADGHMAMRFGPLGAEGGERRLNVLISRAKRRCEVFASITDEDIDTERGRGKGIFAFKLFLHFARTGRLSMAQATGRDHDSPFEVQVANALAERGLKVHAQVGIAGFFIDLAIADPDRLGRYVLGIECDGASYHSSRSARDRDRLRQAVLEDHGWTIHRIWSTDWFQRPQEQLERAVMAVEAARRELDARMDHEVSRRRAVGVEIITVDRGDVTEVGLVPEATAQEPSNLYVEAVAERPRGGHELHETPPDVLAAVIEGIVAVEGPVHVDEVTGRLKSAWGIGRAGARIQANVERAVALSCRAGRLTAEDHFLAVPGVEPAVRDRSLASSASLRRPEMLPPTEIRAAAVTIVRTSFGAASEEIVQGVARAFGLRVLSGPLRDCLRARVEAMLESGELVRSGDLLVAPEIATAAEQASTLH